jgi:hypothetical protein
MDWLRFFIAGVTKIALESVGQAGHLMDPREKFRTLLRDKPKALALLDEPFLNPYMSVARAERVLKVSNPNARQAVILLQKRDVRRNYRTHVGEAVPGKTDHGHNRVEGYKQIASRFTFAPEGLI